MTIEIARVESFIEQAAARAGDNGSALICLEDARDWLKNARAVENPNIALQLCMGWIIKSFAHSLGIWHQIYRDALDYKESNS